MADEEVLWPLRAVSKDATNLTKLDADGNVLTSSTDVDARYVLKDGDTMTGQLIVKPAVGPASPDGSIQVIGDNTTATVTIERNQSGAGQPAIRFKRSRGTNLAPTSVQAGDTLGTITWQPTRADGLPVTAAGFITNYCTRTPLAGENWVDSEIWFSVGDQATPSGARVINISSGWFEVFGNSTLRGDCEVVGNITTSGTAHNFAANSIPVTAINGAVNKSGDIMTGELEAPFASLAGADIGGLQASDITAGEVTADRINLNSTLLVKERLEIGYTLDDGDNYEEYPGTFSMFGESRFNGPVEIKNFQTSTAAALAVIPAFDVGRTAIELVVGAGTTGVLIGTGGGTALAADVGYAINSTTLVKSYHRGRLGLNVVNPSTANQLEVSGKTVLRGELEVVGNITSTGTAHSFAPNSIPSSAVFGNTARTISADDNDPDNAGQMTWDSSFLYLHTGATGWKKVALSAL
jgi:hypothetical protein